jgi:peptidoglycan hydrolase-like protein with peptidoglycan-binding domain
MMTPAPIYPAAAVELIGYRLDAPLFTAAPLGWVLHVQAGDGDPFGYFSRLVEPNRAFSHLWFAKTGLVKQYQTFDRQSWAQEAGDGAYLSAETEGYPGEPLTRPQLVALARWHVWSRMANRIADAPGQPGIGTHSMGGQAWGHPLCPGTIRAAQRFQILTPAPAPPARPPVHPPADPTQSRLLFLANPWMTGADVRAVQARVGAVVDGVYGPGTRAAVIAFQRRHWPTAPAQWDGEVGPATTAALGLVWMKAA